MRFLLSLVALSALGVMLNRLTYGLPAGGGLFVLLGGAVTFPFLRGLLKEPFWKWMVWWSAAAVVTALLEWQFH